jgi:hypothetical protein
MEIGFGLNPTINTGNAPISVAGPVITPGMPIPVPPSAGSRFKAMFGRRSDFAALGLVYIVRFSAEMTTWETNTATPTVVTDNGTMQAVTVPYPLFMSNGRKARFYTVTVDFAP